MFDDFPTDFDYYFTDTPIGLDDDFPVESDYIPTDDDWELLASEGLTYSYDSDLDWGLMMDTDEEITLDSDPSWDF